MSIKQRVRDNLYVNCFLKRKRILGWKREGYPFPPPPDIKQLAVLYHALANRLDVLVETGTYLGDMVWAQKDYFKRIFSIELSKELYQTAEKRFRGVNNVKLLQGDSSVRLLDVVTELSTPALFWLDGHYSGGITALGDKVCPIYEELHHVFGSPFAHTILIDDARLFNGEDGYPTFEEITNFIEENSQYTVRVENDIMILTR